MSWREYWNGDSPVYVSERHKLLHARLVASDQAELIRELTGAGRLPQAGNVKPVILDHGCGEALAVDKVAAEASRLYLCDGAETVRAKLAARLAGNERCVVIAPEEMDVVGDASLDLVIANSLLQYLSRAELDGLLGLWHRKLKPGGVLVLADVMPHGLSALADAGALLRFAATGGFFAAALAGLVRTALSDYRKLRSELGLARYDAGEMLGILTAAGFAAARRPRNIGHNQARMTFLATKSGEPINGFPSVSG